MSTGLSEISRQNILSTAFEHIENQCPSREHYKIFIEGCNRQLTQAQQKKIDIPGFFGLFLLKGVRFFPDVEANSGLLSALMDEVIKNRNTIIARAQVFEEYKTDTTQSLEQHRQQVNDLTSEEAELSRRIRALDLSLTQAQQQLLDNINTMRQSIIDTVRSDLQTRIIDATLQDSRLNDRMNSITRGFRQRLLDTEGGLIEAQNQLREKDQQIQNLTSEVAELRRLAQAAFTQGKSS